MVVEACPSLLAEGGNSRSPQPLRGRTTTAAERWVQLPAAGQIPTHQQRGWNPEFFWGWPGWGATAPGCCGVHRKAYVATVGGHPVWRWEVINTGARGFWPPTPPPRENWGNHPRAAIAAPRPPGPRHRWGQLWGQLSTQHCQSPSIINELRGQFGSMKNYRTTNQPASHPSAIVAAWPPEPQDRSGRPFRVEVALGPALAPSGRQWALGAVSRALSSGVLGASPPPGGRACGHHKPPLPHHLHQSPLVPAVSPLAGQQLILPSQQEFPQPFRRS